MPRSTELLRDIHETNLMYLLLLQRMARADAHADPIAGQDMSAKAREWLAALQPDELVKLARCSVLLAQLDLSPHVLLSALSNGIDLTLASRARTEFIESATDDGPP